VIRSFRDRETEKVFRREFDPDAFEVEIVDSH